MNSAFIQMLKKKITQVAHLDNQHIRKCKKKKKGISVTTES